MMFMGTASLIVVGNLNGLLPFEDVFLLPDIAVSLVRDEGLRGLLPFENIFFLPSIIAAITFAIIAVKTVTWAASERKVAMMSRTASERVETGHN
jgi:hypothetical protein